MEAQLVDEIPRGRGWQYEPKWDGFRCLAFRDGDAIELQSKAGQSLTRYFPEVVAHLRALAAPRFVLDSEIVIAIDGHLSFDDLLQRIHPAESRVRRLAAEHPATLIVFDLLADARGKSLAQQTLVQRRRMLEAFAQRYFRGHGGVRLSPATTDLRRAQQWFEIVGDALD